MVTPAVGGRAMSARVVGCRKRIDDHRPAGEEPRRRVEGGQVGTAGRYAGECEGASRVGEYRPLPALTARRSVARDPDDARRQAHVRVDDRRSVGGRDAARHLAEGRQSDVDLAVQDARGAETGIPRRTELHRPGLTAAVRQRAERHQPVARADGEPREGELTGRSGGLHPERTQLHRVAPVRPQRHRDAALAVAGLGTDHPPADAAERSQAERLRQGDGGAVTGHAEPPARHRR